MTLVRNKDGIESVIKSLDGKLSEAIMHAMTNGPELHTKVSQRDVNINRRYLSPSHSFYIFFIDDVIQHLSSEVADFAIHPR